MPFSGGVKEAAKMLAGLSKAQRDLVLETIAKTDPKMAHNLKQNMVSFEDLVLLTPQMLQELFREINLKTLGLALRLADEKLKSHVLASMARLMKQEVEEVLNGPQRLKSDVEKAQTEILEVVLRKVDAGSIIIDRAAFEKYV